MTLLELCDKLKADLVIRRICNTNGIEYTVKIKGVIVHADIPHWDDHSNQIAFVRDKDVNTALYRLCDKISGMVVMNSTDNFFVKEVVKGDLSVLGVW